jgi:hypothetical protein
MDRIQRKRDVAKSIETAYAYYFMQLFTKQLQSRFRQYSEDRIFEWFQASEGSNNASALYRASTWR